MKHFSMIATATLAGLALAVGTAHAGSLVLGDSGWTASWSDQDDARLDLSVDNVSSSAVFIEKSVNFTTNDPVSILFQPTSFSSPQTPYVVINDESLVNQSGETWTGFMMTLVGTTGSGAQFDNALSQVNQPGGFSVSPFTTADFSNSDTVVTLGGGAIPSGSVWFPGTPGNLWTIHTPPPGPFGLMSFLLVEQPIVTPIPLPAAFWSGLSGLIGLGVLGSVARKRRAA